MKYGFGIDLGGTTVKLAYFDENGKMLDKWEIPTDTSENGKNIARDIAASVEDYLNRKQIPREDIIGLGMGVPGPVSRDGVVHTCINLGWGVLNVEQEMSALTGFPVKAGNDATVAALGEYWVGGGKGYENMVMVTLGTGVGGGVVVEGKVLCGAHGACGEIGHMTLNRDEPLVCNCGKRGCVEQYCSATGIVRTAKRYLEKNDAPSALRDIEDLTCKDVFDTAAKGDAVAAEILDIVYRYLAEFVGNICVTVDPEIVVIGGGVSKAGQPLLDGIRQYLPQHQIHATRNVGLALATLGNDAGAYGACKLVLDAYK